jgi:hypothetical protein
MRQAFETAPRDGRVVVLDDDASGTCNFARWSAEAGEWVSENGEPCKTTPTHWYPYNFFPFSSSRGPPQRSAASEVIAAGTVTAAAPVTFEAFEAQTAAVEAKPTRHARRRFAASSITATLIAAMIIGLHFRTEIAAYVTRYAGQENIFRISTMGGQVAEQATQLASQSNAASLAGDITLHQRTEVDQARVQEGTQVKQSVETSASQALNSLEKEQRTDVLANELAEARRVINRLNLDQQAGALNSAQLLGEERDKLAALAQEATAARQEMTASAVQHRHALEEERARGVALASELATARRESETNAALLKDARADAAQFKQTAGRSMAELQHERGRAEASSRELEIARREIETNVALNKARDYAEQLKQTGEKTAERLQERDRAEALSRELAMARREIETNVALLNEARKDATQFKQAAERMTAERLQHERDSKNALSREVAMALESAQHTMDGRVTLERAANNQIGQQTQALETAAPERLAATEAQGNPEATRLIARARALLDQGNIAAARIVLERAAETGSAQASFTLAETFDPVILSTWGTHGTRGDATKAREFYAKAHAAGIQEGKDRFNALR